VQKRVLASAGALTGFLVVAALQLGLVVVPVLLLLSMLPGRTALRLGLPVCIATVGVMAYATWHALRTRRRQPVGIPVTRVDAPRLWALLDEAAAAAGTRSPDRVTIVADAAAKVIERTRLLGLVGGRRDFYLGLPLLQAWDEAHLRAVAAHELAHFSPRLGRLAPLAYRGRVTVGRTVPRISRRNLAGPLLRAYAGFYRRADQPFSRAQELAADRIAAEFAGRTAAIAVLRDLPALDAAQRIFHAEYLGPGWQAGHVPDDIFGGFLRVLAARADDIAALRARDPGPPSTWDPHPSVTDRIAALNALPAPASAAMNPASPAQVAPAQVAPAAEPSADPGRAAVPAQAAVPAEAAVSAEAAMPAQAAVTGAAPGAAGAVDLLPDETAVPDPADAGGPDATPAAADEASPNPAARTGDGVDPARAPEAAGDLVPDLPGLGRALQAVVFPPQGRTTVGWDEFFGAARTVEMQREADAALTTISRAAGAPVVNAADVLDLASDGRLRKAADTIFTGLTADETAGRIAELVTMLLALAALRSGAARWRHSWTGTAELVAADGAHLDLVGLGVLASDPATVAAARDRLAELGIDAAAEPDTAVAQSRPGVVGGVVNLAVDGSRADVLIVDTGLFIVPGLPRSQNGSAKRRLARFAAADVAQRDNEAPGSRFVSYAEVASATRNKRRSWDLSLRDGGTVSIRSALDSDELPGGWAALDDAVLFLSRTR
jgi:Zn-dependent protease with chaperone function